MDFFQEQYLHINHVPKFNEGTVQKQPKDRYRDSHKEIPHMNIILTLIIGLTIPSLLAIGLKRMQPVKISSVQKAPQPLRQPHRNPRP